MSIVIDYYYNFNKIFNNLKKRIKIDLRNNINFNKII